MRIVRTAGFVACGAASVVVWFALAAAADVGSPTSEPFKPYSPTEQPGIFLPATPTQSPSTQTTAPEVTAQPDQPTQEASPLAAAPATETVSPTGSGAARPVPSTMRDLPERRAPRVAQQARPVLASPGSDRPEPASTSVDEAPGPAQRLRAVLGQLASACEVGVGFAAGGPVLAFAVLAAAFALEGPRVLLARWVGDEDVPELLYAGDLIAPG